MRCPSEIIELSWDDVDLRSETIKISRSHVQNRTKDTKIRYRVPYQTRHSFASWRIMEGANPTWLAEQLGHSVIVLHKTYAKWIKGSDESAREVAKMKEAAVGPKVAPKSAESS